MPGIIRKQHQHMIPGCIASYGNICASIGISLYITRLRDPEKLIGCTDRVIRPPNCKTCNSGWIRKVGIYRLENHTIPP